MTSGEGVVFKGWTLMTLGVLAVVVVLGALNVYPLLPWRTLATRPFIFFALLLALAFLARMDAPLILAPFVRQRSPADVTGDGMVTVLIVRHVLVLS